MAPPEIEQETPRFQLALYTTGSTLIVNELMF